MTKVGWAQAHEARLVRAVTDRARRGSESLGRSASRRGTRARLARWLTVCAILLATAGCWPLAGRQGPAGDGAQSTGAGPVDGAPDEKPPCKTHTASLVASAAGAATVLKVGETLTVTVTLNNTGCVSLGLPQYRLYMDSGELGSVLAPDPVEPVAHSLGVGPGRSDDAEFVLRAVRAGQVAIRPFASFEVHLGYPGPAYWGAATGGSLTVTVTE